MVMGIASFLPLLDLDLSIWGGAQRYSEHRILTAANEGQMDIRLEATRVGLESTGKYLSHLLTLKVLSWHDREDMKTSRYG